LKEHEIFFRILADYRLRHLFTIYFVEGSFLIVICIYLGDNCIVFEHFTASIGDLMGSN
jgi:hypothetical protein